MRKFQNLFETELHSQFELVEFISKLLEKEFKQKKNINLTEMQRIKLRKELRIIFDQQNIPDSLNIEINDNKSILITESTDNLSPEINISELANIEIDKFIESIPALIEEYSTYGCNLLLKNFNKIYKKKLTDHHKGQKQFIKVVNFLWGKAIDLLESYILYNQEIGSDYNDYFQKEKKGQITPKFDMLQRSHARSCQIALEVVTLLRNGFADGAHARWRTLHEIAVETNIIQNHSEEISISFLDHSKIKQIDEARIYQKYCSELGFEPFTAEEMKEFEESRLNLLNTYGNNYACDYGWAISLFNGKAPKFRDLELLTNFSHMRPYYKLSCLNVHGGSRGLLYRLGLNDEQQENVLLAGPSTHGLGDPIQNTAYSMLQITCALLTYETDLDTLTTIRVLHKLEENIFQLVGQIVDK